MLRHKLNQLHGGMRQPAILSSDQIPIALKRKACHRKSRQLFAPFLQRSSIRPGSFRSCDATRSGWSLIDWRVSVTLTHIKKTINPAIIDLQKRALSELSGTIWPEVPFPYEHRLIVFENSHGSLFERQIPRRWVPGKARGEKIH